MTAEPRSSRSSRLLDFWFEAVDPLRLDTFRVLFASVLLLYLGVRLLHPYEWLTSFGLHYTAETRLGIDPVPWPLLPAFLVPPFVALLVGSIVCVIVGWRARLFLWVVLALVVYIQYVDWLTISTPNKLFIVGFAVLALAPPRSRLGDGGELRQSAWPVRVLQATLLIQYLTAGTCKIVFGDWLLHDDVLWTHMQGVHRTDIGAFLLRVLPTQAWPPLMYSALAFEVLAPVLFAVRRTRLLACVWGFTFHMLVAATMNKFIYFGLQMTTFYVLFLEPEQLRIAGRWLSEGARALWHARVRGRGNEAGDATT